MNFIQHSFIVRATRNQAPTQTVKMSQSGGYEDDTSLVAFAKRRGWLLLPPLKELEGDVDDD